jgi:hypothetical protein
MRHTERAKQVVSDAEDRVMARWGSAFGRIGRDMQVALIRAEVVVSIANAEFDADDFASTVAFVAVSRTSEPEDDET